MPGSVVLALSEGIQARRVRFTWNGQLGNISRFRSFIFQQSEVARHVALEVLPEGSLKASQGIHLGDQFALFAIKIREELGATLRSFGVNVLRTRLGRWDVGVNPPPSIGGPVLTAMLRLLADRRERQGHTDAADVIDVQHAVLSYRRRAIDAAEDLETAGRELIATLEEIGPDGLAALGSSPETIHVSAVDDTGLACSITTSAGYGSGLTTPGTGLMMNNALGEPELNRRGLHALRPGTRLASNMAPSTARRDDGAVLAVGSPGADRITTALMQVMGGICLDGHPLQQAIDAPRLHVAFDAQGAARVEYEPGPGLAEALAECRFPTVPHDRIAMYFGGVGAALVHHDGHLEAAGDPRRTAATAVI